MQEWFPQASMNMWDGEAGPLESPVPGKHHTATPRAEKQKAEINREVLSQK